MADLAPNFTARYRVKYSTGGKVHSSVFRVDPSLSPAAVAEEVNDLLDVIAPLLYNDFTVQGAEYAEQYSDVFVPVAAPVVTGGYGAPVASDTARIASFTGRAVSGKKCVIRLAGVFFDPLAANQRDFRMTVAESAVVAQCLAVLDAAPFVAPDNSGPIYWNRYMNVAYSAYWQKRLRG